VVVTVVAITVVVSDRDNRIIVAVVEVFGGGGLVAVMVAVSGANETAGFGRIAYPRYRGNAG
jgi:hypothetical protein